MTTGHPPLLDGNGRFSGGEVAIGVKRSDLGQRFQPFQTIVTVLITPQRGTGIEEKAGG